MVGTLETGRKPARVNLWESIFFILLVLLGIYILVGSSIFDIRQITVTGNHTLSTSEIIKTAGIETGTNIFKADLGQSAEKLKALPMVKDVHLMRRLPGQVLIQVTERRPVALVPWNDSFVQVDASGICLKNGQATGNLPVITGINVRVPPPGRPVQGQGLDAALKVISGLPTSLVGQLSEVHVASGMQVIVYTADGVQCRLGAPSGITEKGRVLQQVLDKVRNGGRKIQYIDLTYAGMPVVKYAN